MHRQWGTPTRATLDCMVMPDTASDATLLVKNADLVVTMDEGRREIPHCDVLIRDNVVVDVGPNLDGRADETLDARGCLVVPGLVNTHNHIWGTLYRGVSAIQEALWPACAAGLTALMHERPVTPEALYAAALANLGKHLLTGCTTTSDHHWVYVRGGPIDFVEREVEAAQEIGIRFHPSRGCMSLGRSEGGLADDEFIEPEDQILSHAQDLIDRYHDPSRLAMIRIILAPAAIYSDSETIFRETRALANQHPGVLLNTHLYQGDSDQMCLSRYGVTPLEFMERVDWVGEEVVYYHFDTEDPDEVRRVAERGTGVSVCTAIDLRMGYSGPSGAIAPVRELLDADANVCIGTSNPFADCGRGMLDDMRVCLLANRIRFDKPEDWVTAREVLWIATRGGARALGRDDIGSIEPGMAADLAVFDLTKIDMAGHQDPVVFLTASCGYTKATIVNGRIIVRDGRLLTVDQDEVARNANEWARRLVPR